MFRFYSCKFRTEPYKDYCARMQLWRDLNVTYSYTIESSYHGFLSQNRETVPFDEQNLGNFGEKFAQTIFEYVLILEEDKRQKMELAKKLSKKRRTKKKTIKEILGKGFDETVDSIKLTKDKSDLVSKKNSTIVEGERTITPLEWGRHADMRGNSRMTNQCESSTGSEGGSTEEENVESD